MKNAVFWDIKTQFVPHSRHYISAAESNQLMLCKIWGFHAGNYGECCLLGYKNPVRTPQETRYVSATEPSQLMLCTIWGFHAGNYGECRLLGYKSPVRTSHETQYVSATKPGRLMLCKIWDFHASDYEECLLLGCDVVRPNSVTIQNTAFFKYYYEDGEPTLARTKISAGTESLHFP
jgi:hypothetical protein